MYAYIEYMLISGMSVTNKGLLQCSYESGRSVLLTRGVYWGIIPFRDRSHTHVVFSRTSFRQLVPVCTNSTVLGGAVEISNLGATPLYWGGSQVVGAWGIDTPISIMRFAVRLVVLSGCCTAVRQSFTLAYYPSFRSVTLPDGAHGYKSFRI